MYWYYETCMDDGRLTSSHTKNANAHTNVFKQCDIPDTTRSQMITMSAKTTTFIEWIFMSNNYGASLNSFNGLLARSYEEYSCNLQYNCSKEFEVRIFHRRYGGKVAGQCGSRATPASAHIYISLAASEWPHRALPNLLCGNVRCEHETILLP